VGNAEVRIIVGMHSGWCGECRSQNNCWHALRLVWGMQKSEHSMACTQVAVKNAEVRAFDGMHSGWYAVRSIAGRHSDQEADALGLL